MKGSLLGSIRTVKHSNVIYALGSRVTLGCIDNSKQDESSLRVIDSIACRTFANIRIAILRKKISDLRNFFSTLSGFVGDGDACYLTTNRKQICICLAGEKIWTNKGVILRKHIEVVTENLTDTVKIVKTVHNNAAERAVTKQVMVINKSLKAVLNIKVTMKSIELNIPGVSKSNLTQYIYGINSCRKRIGNLFLERKNQTKLIIDAIKSEINIPLFCFRRKIIIKRMTGTKNGSTGIVHEEEEATQMITKPRANLINKPEKIEESKDAIISEKSHPRGSKHRDYKEPDRKNLDRKLNNDEKPGCLTCKHSDRNISDRKISDRKISDRKIPTQRKPDREMIKNVIPGLLIESEHPDRETLAPENSESITFTGKFSYNNERITDMSSVIFKPERQAELKLNTPWIILVSNSFYFKKNLLILKKETKHKKIIIFSTKKKFNKRVKVHESIKNTDALFIFSQKLLILNINRNFNNFSLEMDTTCENILSGVYPDNSNLSELNKTPRILNFHQEGTSDIKKTKTTQYKNMMQNDPGTYEERSSSNDENKQETNRRESKRLKIYPNLGIAECTEGKSINQDLATRAYDIANKLRKINKLEGIRNTIRESRVNYTKIKNNMKQGSHGNDESKIKAGKNISKKRKTPCHCTTRTTVESVNIPILTLHNRKTNRTPTGSCPLANRNRSNLIRKVRDSFNKGQGSMIEEMKANKQQERLIALVRAKHYISNTAFTIKATGNQEDMYSMIFEIENVLGAIDAGRRQIKRWIEAEKYDNMLYNIDQKVKRAEESEAILGGEWFLKKAKKVKNHNYLFIVTLNFRKMVSIENKLNIISMFVGDFHEYIQEALNEVKEGKIEDLVLLDHQMEELRNVALTELELIREIVDKIKENNPEPVHLISLYQEIQGILKEVGKILSNLLTMNGVKDNVTFKVSYKESGLLGRVNIINIRGINIKLMINHEINITLLFRTLKRVARMIKNTRRTMMWWRLTQMRWRITWMTPGPLHQPLGLVRIETSKPRNNIWDKTYFAEHTGYLTINLIKKFKENCIKISLNFFLLIQKNEHTMVNSIKHNTRTVNKSTNLLKIVIITTSKYASGFIGEKIIYAVLTRISGENRPTSVTCEKITKHHKLVVHFSTTTIAVRTPRKHPVNSTHRKQNLSFFINFLQGNYIPLNISYVIFAYLNSSYKKQIIKINFLKTCIKFCCTKHVIKINFNINQILVFVVKIIKVNEHFFQKNIKHKLRIVWPTGLGTPDTMGDYRNTWTCSSKHAARDTTVMNRIRKPDKEKRADRSNSGTKEKHISKNKGENITIKSNKHFLSINWAKLKTRNTTEITREIDNYFKGNPENSFELNNLPISGLWIYYYRINGKKPHATWRTTRESNYRNIRENLKYTVICQNLQRTIRVSTLGKYCQKISIYIVGKRDQEKRNHRKHLKHVQNQKICNIINNLSSNTNCTAWEIHLISINITCNRKLNILYSVIYINTAYRTFITVNIKLLKNLCKMIMCGKLFFNLKIVVFQIIKMGTRKAESSISLETNTIIEKDDDKGKLVNWKIILRDGKLKHKNWTTGNKHGRKNTIDIKNKGNKKDKYGKENNDKKMNETTPGYNSNKGCTQNKTNIKLRKNWPGRKKTVSKNRNWSREIGLKRKRKLIKKHLANKCCHIIMYQVLGGYKLLINNEIFFQIIKEPRERKNILKSRPETINRICYHRKARVMSNTGCGICPTCINNNKRCNCCLECMDTTWNFKCWYTVCTKPPRDVDRPTLMKNWIKSVKEQRRKEQEKRNVRIREFREVGRAMREVRAKMKVIFQTLILATKLFKHYYLKEKYWSRNVHYKLENGKKYPELAFIPNFLLAIKHNHNYLGGKERGKKEKGKSEGHPPQKFQETCSKETNSCRNQGSKEFGKPRRSPTKGGSFHKLILELEYNLMKETYRAEPACQYIRTESVIFTAPWANSVIVIISLNYSISVQIIDSTGFNNKFSLAYSQLNFLVQFHAKHNYLVKNDKKTKCDFYIFFNSKSLNHVITIDKSSANAGTFFAINHIIFQNLHKAKIINNWIPNIFWRAVKTKTDCKTGNNLESYLHFMINPNKGINGSPEQVKLNKLKTSKGKKFKYKLNINETKNQRERTKKTTFLWNKLIRRKKALKLSPDVNYEINKLNHYLDNLYPEMDRSREIVLAGLKIRGVLAMFMEYLKQLHPSNRTYEAWKVAKAGLENLGITSHEVTTVINHTYYILGEENYSQKCQELFLTTAETPTDEIDSLIIQHMEENMPNLRIKTKGEVKQFNEPREDRRSTETRYSNEPGSSNRQYRDHKIYSSGEDPRYLNPEPSSSRNAAPQGGSQQPKISKINAREGSFRTVDENKVIDSIAKFLTKRSIDEINYSNPPHVIMRDHLHNYPGEITTIPTQWWHKNNGTRVDVMMLNLHYGCSSYYWRDILVSPYNPLALVGETLLCNLRPFYFLCMLWAVAKANHNYREQLRKMLAIREARVTIKEIMKSNKHWTVKVWHPRSMENALEIFVNSDGNAEVREKFLYEEPMVTPRLHQNREPTFVDGTIPQTKEDLISGFTHLDIFIGAERIQTYDKKEMLALGSEYRTKIIRTWIKTIDKKLGLKDGKKMQERSRSKERRGSRDRRSSTSSKSGKRNHKKETKSNSSERNRHESGYHSRSRERRESKDSTRSKSEDKNRKKEKDNMRTEPGDKNHKNQSPPGNPTKAIDIIKEVKRQLGENYKIPRIRLSEQEDGPGERKKKQENKQENITQGSKDSKESEDETEETDDNAQELLAEAKKINNENIRLEKEITRDIGILRDELKLKPEETSSSDSEDGKYSEGEMNTPAIPEAKEVPYPAVDSLEKSEMIVPEDESKKPEDESKKPAIKTGPTQVIVIPGKKEIEEGSSADLLQKLAILQAQLMEKIKNESKETRKRKRKNKNNHKKVRLDGNSESQEEYSSSDNEQPEQNSVNGKRKYSPKPVKKQKSLSPGKIPEGNSATLSPAKSIPGTNNSPEKSEDKSIPTGHKNERETGDDEKEEDCSNGTKEEEIMTQKSPQDKTRYKSKGDCDQCKGCKRDKCQICSNCCRKNWNKRCYRQTCLRGKTKLGRYIVRNKWVGSVLNQRRYNREARWKKTGFKDTLKGEATDDSFDDRENSSSEDEEVKEYKETKPHPSTPSKNSRQVQNKIIATIENPPDPDIKVNENVNKTKPDANAKLTENITNHIFFTGNNQETTTGTQGWYLSLPDILDSQVKFNKKDRWGNNIGNPKSGKDENRETDNNQNNKGDRGLKMGKKHTKVINIFSKKSFQVTGKGINYLYNWITKDFFYAKITNTNTYSGIKDSMQHFSNGFKFSGGRSKLNSMGTRKHSRKCNRRIQPDPSCTGNGKFRELYKHSKHRRPVKHKSGRGRQSVIKPVNLKGAELYGSKRIKPEIINTFCNRKYNVNFVNVNNYQQLWQRGNSYYSTSVTVNIHRVPPGIPPHFYNAFVNKNNIVIKLKSCEYFFRIMSESQKEVLESRNEDIEITINIGDSNKALEMKQPTHEVMTSTSIQGEDEKVLNHLETKIQVTYFSVVLTTKHTNIVLQNTPAIIINILNRKPDSHVLERGNNKTISESSVGEKSKKHLSIPYKNPMKNTKGGGDPCQSNFNRKLKKSNNCNSYTNFKKNSNKFYFTTNHVTINNVEIAGGKSESGSLKTGIRSTSIKSIIRSYQPTMHRSSSESCGTDKHRKHRRTARLISGGGKQRVIIPRKNTPAYCNTIVKKCSNLSLRRNKTHKHNVLYENVIMYQYICNQKKKYNNCSFLHYKPTNHLTLCKLCFRTMKRTREEEGEILEDNIEEGYKTPVMKSILQRVAASMLTKDRAGNIPEPTGEMLQELHSPETPSCNRTLIKPKQIFPKSAFWIKQLGKTQDTDEHEKIEEETLGRKSPNQNHANPPKKNKIPIIPFKSEDWMNLEIGLNELKAVNTKNILNILNRTQAERILGGNVDPITNKLGNKFARRTFFLKEWEKQLHRSALTNASTETGMPFPNSMKQLDKLVINKSKITIKTNLNIVSDTEKDLMNLYKNAKNDIEKDQIFGILLFNYSLSLNCLRPQTGKNKKNMQVYQIINKTVKTFKPHRKKLKHKIKLFQELTSENWGTQEKKNKTSIIPRQQQQPPMEKIINKIGIQAQLLIFFRQKMRPTIKIYMEMIEEAENEEDRINCTDYLITECNSIMEHLKLDAGELNEFKRHWKDKNDKEKENGRNEAANSIFRLIVMFESITDYLKEMNRWWKKDRFIIPLFGNFYNGPENSVFLASVIGYKEAEEHKQNQTRLGLIELEMATQYINIAAGNNTNAYKFIKHIDCRENLHGEQSTGLSINRSKDGTGTENDANLINNKKRKISFPDIKHPNYTNHNIPKVKSQKKPTQDLSWIHFSPALKFQEQSGNTWIDYNSTAIRVPEHTFFSEKMDFQEGITEEELFNATIKAEISNETQVKKASKLSRRYREEVRKKKTCNNNNINERSTSEMEKHHDSGNPLSITLKKEETSRMKLRSHTQQYKILDTKHGYKTY